MKPSKPYLVRDWLEDPAGEILGYYETYTKAMERVNQQVSDTDGECDCEIFHLCDDGKYHFLE